jgi:adenylosuccinate synthase
VFNEELFEEKVRSLAAGFKKRYGDLLQYDPEEEIARFKTYRGELAPLVIDQLPLLISAQKANTPILIEGANAIMLDIDAGTYPYVTSSNSECSIFRVREQSYGTLVGVHLEYSLSFLNSKTDANIG